MSEQDKEIMESTDVNDVGSSTNPQSSDPSTDGESDRDAGTNTSGDGKESISKEEYESTLRQLEESQKLIGRQSGELNEYRELYRELSPFLQKVQDQPELIQAILDDKLDANLAKAVMEGKVSIQDAKLVNEAHREVKKSMGNTEYSRMTPSDIEKMVQDRVESIINEKTQSLEKGLTEIEQRREFENTVSRFISNTPDFEEYADRVTEWLSEHPDQYDISVAYEAVKGRELVEKSSADRKKRDAEAAKDLASNASGGQGTHDGKIISNRPADDLISPSVNPNLY
jgi:hypothetical protein